MKRPMIAVIAVITTVAFVACGSKDGVNSAHQPSPTKSIPTIFKDNEYTKNVFLRRDGKWQSLYSVQSAGSYDVVVERRPSKVPVGVSEVRLIRLAAFQNLEQLPTVAPTIDSDNASSNPSIPTRLLDSGPLDMSAAGSLRHIVVTTGYSLLGRTDDPNAYFRLKIKKRKIDDH